MDSEEYDGSDLTGDLTNTNVCLSLLDEWVESNDLEDCIQGILFLMYHPNLDDPYSPYFEGPQSNCDDEINYSMIEFERNVKLSLLGNVVDDWITLPRNYHLDEEPVLPELPPKPVCEKQSTPVIITNESAISSLQITNHPSQFRKNIFMVVHNIVRFWNLINKWP